MSTQPGQAQPAYEPARRLAILTAFAIEMEAELTDAAVEMFDRLLGSLFRKARR